MRTYQRESLFPDCSSSESDPFATMSPSLPSSDDESVIILDTAKGESLASTPKKRMARMLSPPRAPKKARTKGQQARLLPGADGKGLTFGYC